MADRDSDGRPEEFAPVVVARGAEQQRFMSTDIRETHLAADRRESRGTAIVVGASLSGLMTGLTLSRAGLHVTVLERSGPSPQSGAALGLVGVDLDGESRLLDGSNRRAPSLIAIAAGGSSAMHSWSAVHSRLRIAAEADPRVELRHHTIVADVGQDADAAWVTTSDGDTLRADVVVGADGHRSVVRRGVAPHKPDATFAGYVLWLGIAQESDLPAAHRLGRHQEGPDMMSGGDDYFVGYPLLGKDGSSAVGSRQLGFAWFDATRNDLFREKGRIVGDVVRRSLRNDDIPERTYRELEAQAQKLWPQPWRSAVLDRIGRRRLIGTPIAEYVPDTIANGRLALVGNAAHVQTPMTGQGFDQSVQDAEALAEALATGLPGATMEECLRSYQMTRLHSARDLVRSGQQFSRSFSGEAA